jgi:hypothetical protein
MISKKTGVITGVIVGVVVILIFCFGAVFSLYFEKNKNAGPADSGNATAQNPAKVSEQKPSTAAGGNDLEPQAYSNAKYGFTINQPKGWSINKQPASGAKVSFRNPQFDNGVFQANISVQVGTTTLGLDNFVKYLNGQDSKTLQDNKLLTRENLDVNGMPAILASGTFLSPFDKMGTLKVLCLYIVKNGAAYVIQGTALESTWDKYESLFKSSLLTFSLD